MTNGSSCPRRSLRDLCARGASGELICVSDVAEVHVHLLQGRIAWATSSAARFAFARLLIERCNLEPAAFRELVRDCKRDGRPFGETLVEWGLATREQVVGALEQQIAAALGDLGEKRPWQTIFLARAADSTYAPTFTFDLKQVFPRAVAPSTHPPLASTESSDLEGMLEQFAESVPDLRWAKVIREGRVTAEHPPGEATSLGAEGATAVLSSGADFVAVRSGLSSLLGFALPSRASLWCGLCGSSALGVSLATLEAQIPALSRSRDQKAHRATGRRWSLDSLENTALTADMLDEVMCRSDALLGVALLPAGGTWRALAWREGLPREAVLERASRLHHALTSIQETAGAGTDAVRELGFHRAVSALGEGDLWHFVAQLLDQAGASLWLVLARSEPQGVGWALSATLTRAASSMAARRPG